MQPYKMTIAIDWFQYSEWINAEQDDNGIITNVQIPVKVMDFYAIALFDGSRSYFAVNKDVNLHRLSQNPTQFKRYKALNPNVENMKTKEQMQRDILLFMNPTKPVEMPISSYVFAYNIGTDGYAHPEFYGWNTPYQLFSNIFNVPTHPSIPLYVNSIQQELDELLYRDTTAVGLYSGADPVKFSGYPIRNNYPCITTLDDAKYYYGLLEFIRNKRSAIKAQGH
jgi:hypothetical protein